jgi:lipopolysaccharide transport system ATP-binding protein
MDDVSKSGRTILFVSHQMGTISKLCSKSILMVNGSVAKYDSTPLVIDYYLQYSSNQIEKIERQDGFSGNHFRAIQMTDKNLFPKQEYSFEDEISVMVKLTLPDYHPALELVMRLVDKNKNAVFTILEKIDSLISSTKRVDLLVTIPSNFLTPGRYSWMMCINHPMVKLFDLQDDILPFNVVDTGSKFAMYEGDSYGNVFANYSINKI